MSTPPPPPPPFGSNPPSDFGSTPQYGQPAPPPGYPQPGYPQPGYPQQGYGQPGMPPGYQAYQQGYGGTPQYAGFGSRLGALIIDGLIGAIFAVPAIVAIFAGETKIEVCEIDDRDRLCEVPTAGTWAIFGVLLGVAMIAYLVIYCRMVGKGQSWGMKAVGNRVVGASTGQPIGTGRAVGRFFARYLSGFVCYLGYLWMLWDSKKQTWHDKIVDTIVVKA